MNVKFCEDQSYYPKLPIQGEHQGDEWLICSESAPGPNDSNNLTHNFDPQTSHEPEQHHQTHETDHQTHEIDPKNPEIQLDNHKTDPSNPDSHDSDSDNLENEPEKGNVTETGAGQSEMREWKTYFRRNKGTNKQESEGGGCPIPEQSQESVTETRPEELVADLPIALRKGKRTCTQHPISKYVAYDRLSPSLKAFVANVSDEELPETYQQAIKDPRWRRAIKEELDALKRNKTWVLTDLPKGKKTVGCKWVFTLKYNPDGTISRYKARLVAKGYTQTHGIDYQETFAPVAKFNTIKVLLSPAASLNWPLMQLDVKNAFLNGDLEEEVYMEVPPGLEGDTNPSHVCRLHKSLYGLKQSPRAWFDRFTCVLKQLDYTQCQTDHTLFVRHHDGKVSILIVYVDDIVLTGDDLEEIRKLKGNLA